MKDALAISESGSNEGPRFGGGLRLSSVAHAPVAQWIEHRPPEPKVAGSNPVGRATSREMLRLELGRPQVLAIPIVDPHCIG